MRGFVVVVSLFVAVQAAAQVVPPPPPPPPAPVEGLAVPPPPPPAAEAAPVAPAAAPEMPATPPASPEAAAPAEAAAQPAAPAAPALEPAPPEGTVAPPPPGIRAQIIRVRDDGSFIEPIAETPVPTRSLLPVTPATQSTVVAVPNSPAAAGQRGEVQTEFVKGDLTNVGLDRLVSRKNRFVVGGGYNRIGKVHYALVNPQLGLRFGEFSLGLGVPLNFEVFSAAYPKDAPPGQNHIFAFNNAGKLRQQDWDEWSEYARVLTYLTYGHKEDPLYIDVGQRHVSTLGHGAIMRRYAPNTDVNVSRIGAQLDTYNDYAGVELMTNDVMRWSILGGLAFIKPLSVLGGTSTFAKAFSVGFTLAADREAPTNLRMMAEPACPLPGQCGPANTPQVNDRDQLIANRAMLPIWGFDVEAKLLKTAHADLKPYFDYSQIAASGPNGEPGGSGMTLGMLGRFNAGKKIHNAFRLVAEVRFLGERYRPTYFDTFYEIDKLLINGSGGIESGSGKVPLTKYAATLGAIDAPECVDHPERCAPKARTGYYFEASYGIREKIGLTFALDGDSAGPAKNFLAHLEIPALSFLQIFGSLYKRGFEDMSTIVALDEHAIGFAGARLKILPILFLSVRAFKSFELDAFQAKTWPLGTLQYQNVQGFAGDLELGWEFN